MKRLTSLALALGLMAALTGCQSKDDHDPYGDSKMAKQDMCKHCAGTQLCTAEGTCPDCNMALDCCSMCTGEQKLTDGKCPKCGMKVPTES